MRTQTIAPPGHTIDRIRLCIFLVASIAVAACVDEYPIEPTGIVDRPPLARAPLQTIQNGVTSTCVGLVTGRNGTIGQVCLLNDASEVFLSWKMNAGWRVTGSQLAMATEVTGLPQHPLGHARLKDFPIQMTHAGTSEFRYSVPFQPFGVRTGTNVAVALHADVIGPGGKKDEAWGAGDPFRTKGNDGAMHFPLSLSAQTGLVGFVSSQGGVIEGKAGTPLSGVKIHIRPGTFDGDHVVTVGPGDAASFTARLSASHLGILAGPVVDIHTTATSFGKPVSLTLPYDASAFPQSGPTDVGVVSVDAEGQAEAHLGALQTVNANGEPILVTGEWLESARYEVDATAHTVTIEVFHFSSNGVVVIPVDQYHGSTSPEGYNDLTQQPPKANQGPRGSDPTAIVIHSTDSTPQELSEGAMLWTPYNSKYAAHYYIHTSGRVSHLIPDANMAAHAGDAGYNRNAIGIELQQRIKKVNGVWVPADGKPYSDEQIESLKKLIRDLVDAYGIERESIIGHVDVPGAAERDKGDPRDFDWSIVDDVLSEPPPDEPPPDEPPPDEPPADSIFYIGTRRGRIFDRTPPFINPLAPPTELLSEKSDGFTCRGKRPTGIALAEIHCESSSTAGPFLLRWYPYYPFAVWGEEYADLTGVFYQETALGFPVRPADYQYRCETTLDPPFAKAGKLTPTGDLLPWQCWIGAGPRGQDVLVLDIELTRVSSLPIGG